MSAFEAQKLVGAILLLVIALVVIIRRDVLDLREKKKTYARVVRFPERAHGDLPRHATR